MSGHYFAFSRDFVNGRRLCGECRLNYDEGDHIEISVLKPYTSYVCPTGGGLGHSGHWTGAYRPEMRRLSDAKCICGEAFVEEDHEQWRVSFEMCTPQNDDWHPVSVVRSKHGAHQQYEGLLDLVSRGEPIRNVVLEQVAS